MKDRIRLEIAKFMEHNDVLTKLENDDWYCVENGLVELLTDYENTISSLLHTYIEREYHKCDLLNEIAYMNEEREDDDKITLDELDIEYILDDYEDMLGNSEDWHFCLIEAIRRNRDV